MDIEKARLTAAKKGRTEYLSDRPCTKHGLTSRYVSTGACAKCQRIASAARIAVIKEKLQAVKHGI